MKRKNLTQFYTEIVNYYLSHGYGLTYLAKKYHTSLPIIKDILAQNNVKVKTKSEFLNKYNIKVDFFNNIDTSEKAYWLGFLYADGTVQNRGGRRYMEIALQEIDKPILELFSKNVFGNKPLYKQKWRSGKNRDIITYGYRLSTGNKDFVENLVKNGCLPNKSFTVNFPSYKQVPDHLIHHFIRGYFDGDGSICMKKRHGKEIGASFSVICSINFGKELFKLIMDKLGLKMRIEIISNRYLNMMCKIETTKKDNIIILFDYLYKNCNEFKLERKYNKFIECILKIKNKRNLNKIPKSNFGNL